MRLFPPVVTGTVITIIGITLLPVAAMDAGGGNFAFANPDLVPPRLTFGSPLNLALSFGTILVILLITRYARGFLNTVAVLVGLAVGTGVAAFISDGAGGTVADFSAVAERGLGRLHHAVLLRGAEVRRAADPVDDRRHADHRGRDHRRRLRHRPDRGEADLQARHRRALCGRTAWRPSSAA